MEAPVDRVTKLINQFRSVYQARLLSIDDQSRLAATLNLKSNNFYKITFSVSDVVNTNVEVLDIPYYDYTPGSWIIEGHNLFIALGSIKNAIKYELNPILTEPKSIDALIRSESSIMVAILNYLSNSYLGYQSRQWITLNDCAIHLAKYRSVDLRNSNFIQLKPNRYDLSTLTQLQIIYTGLMPDNVIIKYIRSDSTSTLRADLAHAMDTLIGAFDLGYYQASDRPIKLWQSHLTPVRLKFESISTYGYREVELGRGTYGRVYLTRRNEDVYAIKIANKDPIDGSIDGSLVREISALVQCNHPNIIELIDVNVDINETSLIMPAAQGTLSDIMSRINQNDVPDYAYQLISAVNYLNNLDIIHRDIKPPNILFFLCPESRLFRLVLADFGLARTLICNKGSDERLTENLFTRWYRPPEVLLGLDYGIKGDLWSVGCVIGEMISSKVLFPGVPSVDKEADQDMLERIFTLLGSPIEDEWEDAYSSPNWLPEYEHRDTVFDTWLSINQVDHSMSELLDGLLTLNPFDRMSAVEAMNSRALTEVKPIKCWRAPIKPSPTCEQILKIRAQYPSEYQFDATEYRQSVLVWLVDVCSVHHLTWDTLFLSYYIFDTYMETKSMLKLGSRLQAYGIVSLILASKIKDQIVLNTDVAVIICDRRFSKDELLIIEVEIARSLQFNLNVSTGYDFYKLNNDQLNLIGPFILVMMYWTSLPFSWPESKLASQAKLLTSIYMNSIASYNQRSDRRQAIRQNGIKLILPDVLKELRSVIKFEPSLVNPTRVKYTKLIRGLIKFFEINSSESH